MRCVAENCFPCLIVFNPDKIQFVEHLLRAEHWAGHFTVLSVISQRPCITARVSYTSDSEFPGKL